VTKINNKRIFSKGVVPILVETVEGTIAEEKAGLLYIANINGRPILAKIHPGIPKAPTTGDRVTIQILPYSSFALIISIIET